MASVPLALVLGERIARAAPHPWIGVMAGLAVFGMSITGIETFYMADYQRQLLDMGMSVGAEAAQAIEALH